LSRRTVDFWRALFRAEEELWASPPAWRTRIAAPFSVDAEEVQIERLAVQVVGESEVALRLRCDGTPADFVRYPYPPLEPPTMGAEGVAVATQR
jgi:hypothetical protein